MMRALDSYAEVKYMAENTAREGQSFTSMRNMLARDPAVMDLEMSI